MSNPSSIWKYAKIIFNHSTKRELTELTDHLDELTRNGYIICQPPQIDRDPCDAYPDRWMVHIFYYDAMKLGEASMKNVVTGLGGLLPGVSGKEGE